MVSTEEVRQTNGPVVGDDTEQSDSLLCSMDVLLELNDQTKAVENKRPDSQPLGATGGAPQSTSLRGRVSVFP